MKNKFVIGTVSTIMALVLIFAFYKMWGSDYTLIVPTETLNEERRAEYIKTFAEKDIDHKIDEQGNTHVKREDRWKYVICCE
ncbi:hypothetical protein IC620_13635 [Hazenella sp. IB182357]|uniref:Uncharacterized protein n=1 Tax=Polycladospora coralii TaxID=2771432 RepID=A0A926N7J4_9BACL|nr:hypothetical protein [Polycladospora coralii]MBD1373391.1 hypothetical protein [Polycladospora coralii]MBS7531611.1 hypothetical protein [Polycladospora coralii]